MQLKYPCESVQSVRSVFYFFQKGAIMKTRLAILLIVFFQSYSIQSYSQYVIKGKVTGYNDKPMLRSDIFLISNETRFPRPIIKSYKVDRHGFFQINLKHPGVHRFRITGVNHKDYELPVYLEKPDTIVVNVKLAAIKYKTDLQEIQIRTNFDFEIKKFENRKNVAINSEGIFVADFISNDETLEYEIYGIDEKNTHLVNGIQADYFIPDGSDYMSVLKTAKDSVVTIKFDPALLIRSDKSASYEIVRAPERSVKFFTIHDDYAKRYQDYSDFVREGRSRGIYDSDYANNYGWKKDFKQLDKKLKTEKDPFLRQGWYISRLKIALSDAWAKSRAKISKKLAEDALREIPPDSPLWSYHPHTLSAALKYASETKKSYNEVEKQHIFFKEFDKPFLAYINQAFLTHPDSSIHRTLLYSAVHNAYKFKDFDLFDKYYNQFLQEFEGTSWAKNLEKRYSPFRKIKPGNPIPNFSFTSVDNPKNKISNKDLLGKNYIIDFWGLWCGPCKPSHEILSRMYEEFKGPDFEIISVSMCFKIEDVFYFRKNKLPMPWFNTHLEKWQPEQGVLLDFEVVAIPKVILVDKTGIISEVYKLENMIEILRKN